MWEELVKSLIHHPSSQGWAPRCPMHFVSVFRCSDWVRVSFFPLSIQLTYSQLECIFALNCYMYKYMYMHMKKHSQLCTMS